MKTSDKVKAKIDKLEQGFVFTYRNFDVSANEAEALKKYINRLVDAGKIARLSKGRFYKPRKGITSDLRPNEYEIVKDLLMDGTKTIGYITGYPVFNSFKLTTQMPNVIQIGMNFDKKSINRGIYPVKFVRQWNKITKANIPLLQLLDCIRFIKIIPDSTIGNSLTRIKSLISELSESERKHCVQLAISYPASTRALTGAIFELLGYNELSEILFKTLKYTSWYIFNVSQDQLPNKLKWRIK